MRQLDEFTRSYIETMLWAELDDSEEGNPLDENYTADDLSDEAMERIAADCAAFQAENALDIASRPSGRYSAHEMAGHDFWLTRQGHGAGFWDGDWPDDAGERLTAASKRAGNIDVYVGDDGKLYLS